MARALGLAAYRALSRRKPQPASIGTVPRPQGELVWAHATNATRFDALCDLGARLRTMRSGVTFLVTVGETGFERVPAPRAGCDHVERLGRDHPGGSQQFLDHWRPDACLWTGGDLMPDLIGATARRKVPMMLLDVGEADLSARRPKWFPDLTRTGLDRFSTIMAHSPAAAAQLKRLGVEPSRVRVTTRLRSAPTPPPCSERHFAGATDTLASRPVWLAAHAQPGEFSAILAAHRAAVRLLHRLVLVIMPENPEDAESLKQELAGSGLRHVDWQPGTPIEDTTQVLISNRPADLGLWYRVAPLTFMASSLHSGNTGAAGGRNPLDAAALGSAVIYGPDIRNHHDAYARLAAAGAARAIGDADELGAAVIQLIAPDLASKMALAGWEVATEGAQLTDTIIDLIQDMLDLGGAGDAGA